MRAFLAPLFGLALLAVSAVSAVSAQPAAKPNIVFILADDLGYGELGSYGQKKILTPQLDRMAAEGMRFTQFYAGSTVCAPVVRRKVNTPSLSAKSKSFVSNTVCSKSSSAVTTKKLPAAAVSRV